MLITVKEVSNVGIYQDYNIECTIDRCYKSVEIRKWCCQQFDNDYHMADWNAKINGRHQENIRWVVSEFPTDLSDGSIESDRLVLLFRDRSDLNWFMLRWS
jgi:hypothetical protein